VWKQREASAHSTVDELREQASRLRRDLSSSLARAIDEFDSLASELESAESGLGEMIDELQRARQDFLDIFESSPNAYVVTDETRVIIQMNRSAARLLKMVPSTLVGQVWPEVLGYSPSHANGEPAVGPSDLWNSVLSHDLAERDVEIDADLRARVTWLPNRGAGQRLLWHLSAPPRTADVDQPPSIAADGGCENLTTEEALTRFIRRAFDESLVGIILLGTQGEQAYLNRFAARLLGRPDASKQGLERYDGATYFPDGRRHAISTLCRERILRGKAVVGETAVIRSRNGTQRYIRICGGPVTDDSGKQVGAMLVVDDVTPIHEEQRRRAEWLSLVVHDLRAPLAIISGYAQLLQKDSSRQPGQGSEPRALETIRANTVRLNRMISDLLDASRIEIRKLSLQRQRINLVTVVQRVAEDTQHTAPDRPVEVAAPLPGDCLVLVDPERIEQVLENLLQNALKYGTPGTPVQIGVASDTQTVRVRVINQGPGIPPEEVSLLFRRFHRARTASQSKSGGLGLGLYIAQGIVEAHGGKISVESVPNQTTTFTISLPSAVDISSPGIQNAC